jgi:rhodanese-related sulfurtransferase
MRKWMMMSLMVLMISALGGCQSSPVEKIDADTALQLLASDPNIVLLDVREYNEYVLEHIEGSVLMPLSIIDFSLEKTYPDKDTTFIVYCRSGNRSVEAIKIMVAQGYTNIYDLGGIIDWPYETIFGPPQ